jgi:hypothetical protein
LNRGWWSLRDSLPQLSWLKDKQFDLLCVSVAIPRIFLEHRPKIVIYLQANLIALVGPTYFIRRTWRE